MNNLYIFYAILDAVFKLWFVVLYFLLFDLSGGGVTRSSVGGCIDRIVICDVDRVVVESLSSLVQPFIQYPRRLWASLCIRWRRDFNQVMRPKRILSALSWSTSIKSCIKPILFHINDREFAS